MRPFGKRDDGSCIFLVLIVLYYIREVCVRTTTRNRNLLGIIIIISYAFYYCLYIIIITITIMLDQKTRNSLADRGAGRWYI